MKATLDHHRAQGASQQRARMLAEHRAERQRHQVAALSQLDCMRAVPGSVLEHLAPLCTVRAFVPGTVILNERTASPFLYLVLRGTISLTLRDRTGHEVLIGVLDRGDCFNEGPLFGDLFRGATVHAATTCYLLQLPLEQVRNVLEESPELDKALRSTYRRRLIESTLGRVPAFSELSPVERGNVASLLRRQHFERGALIIREGEPGSALYLIESGQAVVEREGQAIAYLDEGTFFGEISLMTKEPRNADIRAMTPVEALALPHEVLRGLLARQPALAQQLQTVVEERQESGSTAAHDTHRTHELTQAVERGLLRGTQLLVRDPALCKEGCHICEDACASRFGQSRIHTAGVNVGGLNVADTCRQCRVGAECMEVCPEGAIQWNGNGALVITDQCNGCGACVPACPYDAMTLVEPPQPSNGPLWQLWRRVAKAHIPTIPLEAAPKPRADKCDLCHGHDNMACISACPTGALRLVPVEDLFPL